MKQLERDYILRLTLVGISQHSSSEQDVQLRQLLMMNVFGVIYRNLVMVKAVTVYNLMEVFILSNWRKL